MSLTVTGGIGGGPGAGAAGVTTNGTGGTGGNATVVSGGGGGGGVSAAGGTGGGGASGGAAGTSSAIPTAGGTGANGSPGGGGGGGGGAGAMTLSNNAIVLAPIVSHAGGAGGIGGASVGSGGGGGAGGGFVLTGGPPVAFSGTTIAGSVTGGVGGNGGAVSSSIGNGGNGGDGGTAFYVQNSNTGGSFAVFNNAGLLRGGNGGNGGAGGVTFGVGGNGGDGGTGFSATGYTVNNTGSIQGGTGGLRSTVGANGVGIDGAGGVGISGSSLTINNSGMISGGGTAFAIDFTGGTNKLTTTGGTLTGGINMNGALTLDQTSSGSTTYSNIFSGTGALSILASSNIVTLSASNSYSGTTFLDSGTLSLANVGAAGTSTIRFSGGAEVTALQFVVSGTFSNSITMESGSSARISAAAGVSAVLKPIGMNVVGGPGRTLHFGSETATGTVTLSVNSATIANATAGAIDGGTLKLDPLSNAHVVVESLRGGFAVGTGAATATLDLGGKNILLTSLSGNASGVITNSLSSTAVVTVFNETDLTFAGNISDGATAIQKIALNVTGAGSLELTGVNLLTGATTVETGGTLSLSGGGSIARSSSVTVLTGATFDVSGITADTAIKTLSNEGTVVIGAKVLNITAQASDVGGTFIGSAAGVDALKVTLASGQLGMNLGSATFNTWGANDVVTVTGNALNNVLVGSSVGDFLFGLNGADVLRGDGGGDNLWGGLGADKHIGGNDVGIFDFARYDDANYGNLTIRLDNSTLNAGAAAVGDTYTGIEGLVGGAGKDTIVGDAGGNLLFGGGEADMIFGQDGVDTLDGGAGGDNLWGGLGADKHTGGDDAGLDFARYDDANYGNLTIRLDVPASNVGAAAVGDTYVGIEGLVGGVGADVIIGNASANFLFGQDNADFIDGLAGNDTLNGGAGADRFRFSSALGTGNVDTITDFVHLTDDIVLSSAMFAAIGPTLTADELRFGTAAADANDFLIYNSATGQLFYDANGSTGGGPGQIQFATVAAGVVLDINDFVIL